MTKQDIRNLVMAPIKWAGFDVYFVGGCVRDKLLGKTPHDYDLVTNAKPEDLHKIFSKFSNVSSNSEAFGVTMPLVGYSDDQLEEIEIATFRRDVTSGRHPEVSLDASIEQDAGRRDFTINALYESMDGEVLDPTGYGLYDIEHKILRFVGNADDRIAEDPLRALRLIRFESKLGFKFVEK